MARKLGAEAQMLSRALEERTREGVLYEKLEQGRVRCHACGHRCLILDGFDGICRVRFNRGGVLRVPHGYVSGLAVDPIEKKPFFHVLPGADALSFGMLGCDYHCPYCPNWLTTQALRDDEAVSSPRDIEAAALVALAKKYRSPVIVSTYNEPLITSEWAVEVFSLAREDGLLCGYVSNGNATREVLEYIRPYVDLYKVDLKGFRDAAYRALGGKLSTVLDTIRLLREKDFWVEIVTLLVPGFNDSSEELGDLTAFIASVSPDIPWHVTAFHRDYKMSDHDDTTAMDLMRAADIGKEAGLRYVYAGNLPGRVGDLENTSCPGCGEILVERRGFEVLRNRVGADGKCPGCGQAIAGRWSTDRAGAPS